MKQQTEESPRKVGIDMESKILTKRKKKHDP